MKLNTLFALGLVLLPISAIAQQTSSGFDSVGGLPLVFANQGQKVGEWNTQAIVVNGAVQVGQTTVACDTTKTGQIRWNQTTAIFEGCNGTSWQPLGGGAPTGQIGFFQLASCPSGWIPADGTNGTVDLRGEFVRALDMGRGVDPGRTLGSWEAATAINNLTYDDLTIEFQNPDSAYPGYWSPFDGFNCCGAMSTWFTVRPRNVALLACEKI